MATASVTTDFVNGTIIESAEVDQNFTDLVTFLNVSVVHVDGSKAMTGLLTLHSSGVKFPTSAITITDVLDEDAMGTDSATVLATQQSIKAYADLKIPTANLLDEDNMGSDDATKPASQQSIKKYIDDQVALQVALSLVDAAGDLLVGTADNAIARLALGAAAGARLGPNAAVDGLEWVAAPDSSVDTTARTNTGSGFTTFTGAVSVTITTGTLALVFLSISQDGGTTSAVMNTGFAVSGATTIAANDETAVKHQSQGANHPLRAGIATLVTLTAGENVFSVQSRISAGTHNIVNQELIVVPF